jgi:hypothetical protein
MLVIAAVASLAGTTLRELRRFNSQDHIEGVAVEKVVAGHAVGRCKPILTKRRCNARR